MRAAYSATTDGVHDHAAAAARAWRRRVVRFADVALGGEGRLGDLIGHERLGAFAAASFALLLVLLALLVWCIYATLRSMALREASIRPFRLDARTRTRTCNLSLIITVSQSRVRGLVSAPARIGAPSATDVSTHAASLNLLVPRAANFFKQQAAAMRRLVALSGSGDTARRRPSGRRSGYAHPSRTPTLTDRPPMQARAA